MTTALIGHTGFVGGTIARQRPVDAVFHRPDLADIRGRAFSILYISAAPAEKWVANADPRADAAGVEMLVEHLRHATTDLAVLISTIDVYPNPVDVDELTPLDPSQHSGAYGRNRLLLEDAVQEHFPRSLLVRLPALFGIGLKKNLVFDLLHEREEFCHRDSSFQFYDMRRLCDDIDVAERSGLDLVNLVTEPVTATRIAEEVFGRRLQHTEGAPARYDVTTRHAGLYGGARHPGYIMAREEVLAALSAWVAEQRASR